MIHRNSPSIIVGGRGWLRFLIAIAALAGLAVPAAALHPNHPLGFDPERAVLPSAEGIDTIDLFSGSLLLTIPIGPFTLNYSSNVWRYRAVLIDDEEVVEAFPDRTTNAGLGWHLGWGEVYHKDHGLNDTGTWLFIGRDGGRHTFHRELHEDDDPGLDDSDVWYTRDGSYLRLHKVNNYYVEITFPDGNTARFDSGSGGLQSTYYLQKIWSPFASADDPDLLIQYDRHPSGQIIGLERTVTDRHGRTHYVHLTDDHPWLRVITQIDLEGFQGQRMLYNFTYSPIHVNRSCKDNDPATGTRIVVPHLRQVSLPDGTVYSMKEGENLLYYNLCQNEFGESIDDVAGVLNGINLPTGGKIRWSFQEYEFPPGDNHSVFNTSAGVETRKLLLADGSEHGSWHYRTSSFNPGGGLDPEIHTEVSQPTGDCTKHYFNARYWITPSEWRGWEYGLPFVYSEEVAGRYLSSRVFPSTTGNGSCTGQALRSTYLRFRHDWPPGGNVAAEWYALNRAVTAMRVVYHDDGDRWADTEMSQFDGLGNFRRTVETGNFRSDSTTAERRETLVDYNRSSGTYPGSYQQVEPDEPWILGVFGDVTVTENDALGESVSRVEHGFDDDTGFLFCTRDLASGTARSNRDLLTVRLRNAGDHEGLVSDVKRYGGDNQTLSVAGGDCGTVPATPAYWLHHDYQVGLLAKSTPRTTAGANGPFPIFDVDLDSASGLVHRQRDTAGYQTTLGYDQAGRLTTVTPQDGARLEYQYLIATGGSPPQVNATYRPATGSTVLARTETVFDDFGRPSLERRLLPGGGYAERETLRNARSWTTSVSQWGNTSKVTEYRDFDPFGRPATIRPPDGAGHDTRLSYLGDRIATSEVKIALVGGETYVPRIEERDRYGRLRLVRELSGASPGPEETPTSYEYDVGGRLTRIVTGVGQLQTRRYVYDNRGFLLSETYPEKGATGNGTVYYYDYDAQGLIHRKVDGPNHLGFDYDFMGRLTDVEDRNHGDRQLTHLTWDTAASFGKGKLHWASEHNWLDLPWNAQGEEEVQVRQTFDYAGIGGAVSSKRTAIIWSLADAAFQQGYLYDPLGNVELMGYPFCTAPMSCTASDAGELRQVAKTYSNGWLSNVTGWTDQITYHTSGVWSAIHHVNGVVDRMTADPNFTRRPQRLYTTGVLPASENYDSGTMTYDGAGFLKTIGSATYNYDKAGRVAKAKLFGFAGTYLHEHDRFGNLTSVTGLAATTGAFTIDSATNRLASGPNVSYDAAGNLQQWDWRLWDFDARNRVVRQMHMLYLYDAFGERTMSISNLGLGVENARFHLRDPGHTRLSKILFYQGTWSHERDYVYAGGRLLASTDDGTPQTAFHYHQDHLRSTRLTTYPNANSRFKFFYMPYGAEIFGNGDDEILFTGQERDASTGADYMHARHYLEDFGHFLSVDPVRGDPRLPQSLNRNAFALGNPVNLSDPSGASPPLCCYWSNVVAVASSLPRIPLYFYRHFNLRNSIPNYLIPGADRGGGIDVLPNTPMGEDTSGEEGGGEEEETEPPKRKCGPLEKLIANFQYWAGPITIDVTIPIPQLPIFGGSFSVTVNPDNSVQAYGGVGLTPGASAFGRSGRFTQVSNSQGEVSGFTGRAAFAVPIAGPVGYRGSYMQSSNGATKSSSGFGFGGGFSGSLTAGFAGEVIGPQNDGPCE